MKVYIGFDLGTTNLKMIVVGENGIIIEKFSRRTPIIVRNRVKYYDIFEAETKMRQLLDEIAITYEIAGIAFTSMGESVVPLRDEKVLHPPLMWDDTVTQAVYEKLHPEIEKHGGYSITGVPSDFRYSVYKIAWMTENLELGEVDLWLPISSYFQYLFTRNPAWTESQACRSYLYDIHKREWNEKLVEIMGLEGKLKGIEYTGTANGISQQGFVVGNSGHDHITGLYGMYVLSDYKPFFYDSMGTSSVLGAVLKISNGDSKSFEKPFFREVSGVIGAAFQSGQYYIQNSFRYFGYLIERLALFSGSKPDKKFFDKINSEIEALKTLQPKALFSIGGDCLLGTNKNNLSLLNSPVDISLVEMMQSIYIYLSSMSRLIYESLTDFCSPQMDYIAGGKIVNDKTFMKYKASILNREIKILNTDEVTALGAAVSALTASDNQEALHNLKENISYSVIEPDASLVEPMNEAFNKYNELAESPIIDYLT